jgi:hypothetical protein
MPGGCQATWEDREPRDRSLALTLERYHEARERLIHSRATHLDQLIRRAQGGSGAAHHQRYPAGQERRRIYPADDLRYVEDLGLIVTKPHIRIANRIYRCLHLFHTVGPARRGARAARPRRLTRGCFQPKPAVWKHSALRRLTPLTHIRLWRILHGCSP